MTNRGGLQPAESWVGRRVEVDVGSVAHGGHCVARHEGRVIFVRHALPGERVVVEVTSDAGKNFCRGDAVEVLTPAPGRVSPPCPYAHPGGCGGCDFQHVRPADQRGLKAAVIVEQFRRLAALDVAPVVEPLVPPDLGWRRRVRYAVAEDGSLGLHAHHSHRVVSIDRCLIGAPGVGDNAALSERWPHGAEVELAASDQGDVAVVLRRTGPKAVHGGRSGRRRRPPQVEAEVISGPPALRFNAAGRDFAVSATGFWQTHPGAPDAYLAALLEGIEPRPGDHVLDLYAGAGLFTAALAEVVGPTGRVLGLEGDRQAAADATANVADLAWSHVQRAAVTADSVQRAASELGRLDFVVLDPPRSGAGADVMAALIAAAPRAIGYIACDPAALARDVATAATFGWRLRTLRAFDAYPMTHHVECVAGLEPATR